MTLARSPRCLMMLAILTCFAVASLAGAQASVAATKSCDIQNSPKYPHGGPGGYFTSLKVTGVTCKTGKKLMVAYYKCRVKNGGGKGTCNGRTVNGLKCGKESRPAESQTDEQLNARVTCKKGSKKVVHTYQHNFR